MEREDRRSQFLQRVSVRELLASLGVDVEGSEGPWLVARCPLHDDRNPSFRVAENDIAGGSRNHEKGFCKRIAGS